MSTATSIAQENQVSQPTWVRYCVLSVATLMSVLLYLDRFAVGIASEYIREDLRMSQTQVAWFISAFFWSYALCQVPAGWLSDRFGARAMLTFYIVAWSVFTGLMGLAHSVWLMLWLRLFCGIAQAGAYPTSAGLIRYWFPLSFRGTASSIVGLGGRFGAVLAPILTAWFIIAFVAGQPAPQLKVDDIRNEFAFVASFDPEKPARSPKLLDQQRRQFVIAFTGQLTESERDHLIKTARTADEQLKARVARNETPGSGFDLRDWIPSAHEERSRPEGLDEIVATLSEQMSRRDMIDFSSIAVPLPQAGQPLLDRLQHNESLSGDEIIRLNRIALETLFRAEIRKSQGPGWRPTMIVYGILGILVAVVFAAVTRNSPVEHPWCNEAERDLINDHQPRAKPAAETKQAAFPCRAILTSLSLWGNSMTQFLTNVGWFFVVSYLPRYLEEVHRVPLVGQGVMTAFPSGTGIVGLFVGGRCTDWAVRRLGLKWGRLAPLVGSRFTAAAGYALCLVLGLCVEPGSDKPWLPWLYILGLCIASTSTDFGSPAIWAYAQDVGGRYTGSILGWANMWGNLGAAVSPLIYNRCLGETPSIGQWNLVFAICCGAFIFSGLSALLLDATKPLTVES
jgi:MFS transporter, ACS family, glucarate transporter